MRNLIDLVLIFLSAAGWYLFLVPTESVRSAVGDEPHYLIISESLERYHSADITQAYQEGEMANILLRGPERNHTPEELAEARGVFGDYHAFAGRNGLFSIHNLGLPLLLTPVLLLGGTVLSAKILMLLLACLLPLIAWRAAGLFIRGQLDGLLAAGALVLVMPFVIAAAQIYPDLLAGSLFALFLLDLFKARLTERGPGWSGPGWSSAVALSLLPWLHIRLAAPALVCLGVALWLGPKDRARSTLLRVCLPVLISLAILATYNRYAFGGFGGAYDKTSIEFSLHSLMVLLGLHLDQFQGTFIEAPIMLFGMIGLAGLARRDWRLALIFVFLYGSMVVPNALHPNWYGGGSFVGRFSAAGTVLLIIPAAQGLSLSLSRWPWPTRLLCLAHILFEAYAFAQFCGGEAPVYNQEGSQPWLENYLTVLGHQYWFPSFYRVDLALRHWPNLGWLLALPCLCWTGWDLAALRRRALVPIVLAVSLAAAGSVAGAYEDPFWASIPYEPPQTTDLDLHDLMPYEALRIRYGEPADAAGAAILWKELAKEKVSACIEGLDEKDLPSPDAKCPAKELLPRRVAMVTEAPGEWHVTYLDDAQPDDKVLKVTFTGSPAFKYMGQGWSVIESWGVWSDSAVSELKFKTDDLPVGDLRLDVEALAYVPIPRESLRVPVIVDGKLLAIWTLHRDDVVYPHIHSLWIPGDLVRRADKLSVRFDLSAAVSPKLAGESEDFRRMGIGLKWIKFTNADR